ncbi:TspO/MBR family protein [uncultured Sphingomonas sp.]|uniref:TspO/MBR family protein n=1 Tax=uncultured Sphingomonas sp. TaxID=158754 RepID=UPI0035CB4056
MGGLASKGQLRMSFLRWAVVTVPAVLLLGFASGSIAPAGSANAWYAALVKPAATPPGWAFPVAWTTLYALMGLALAIVLHARGARGRGTAIALFAVALGLNLVWPPLFFGAHRVTLAWMLIAAMLVSGILATVAFGRIRTTAAWALVPYLVWIGYAGVLNWRIDRLNPGAENLAPGGHTTQIIG